MHRVLPGIGRLVIDDEGQDLLEYGLLVSLIVAVAIVGVTTLGQTIHTVFWQAIRHGF